MSSNYDIKMSLNDTLELDAIIEEWNNTDTVVSVNRNEHNSSGFKTQTYVFDPTDTGYYEITVNDQKIIVKVESPVNIPDSALTQNLMSWYRFEDGDARDYASNSEYPNITYNDSTAYDGVVNGAVYKPNKGVKDFDTGINSGAFDTSNNNTDSIDLPDNFVPSGNSTRTTMCWVKVFGSTGDRQMAVGYGNGDNAQTWEMEVYQVYNKGNGQVTGALGIHTWSGYNRTDSNVISLNEWVHFAATHDGNPSNIQLYLNGQPIKTNNNNDDSSSLNTDTSNHKIGYSPAHGNGDHTFNGIIDDYRIYNTNLEDAEIEAIYDRTKPSTL